VSHCFRLFFREVQRARTGDCEISSAAVLKDSDISKTPNSNGGAQARASRTAWLLILVMVGGSVAVRDARASQTTRIAPPDVLALVQRVIQEWSWSGWR
jgi:hypothetical protein